VRTAILAWLVTAAGAQTFPFPGPGHYVSTAAGYGHQSTITLGNTSQIPASQSNFTVLVCANMTLGNGNACPAASGLRVTGSGGYVTSSSGYDIVFSTTVCSSPTLMSWEMPSYTGSSGAMEAWVLVPSLTAAGSFYMCAGNPAIATFQGGATGAAWNGNYQGIWHLPNGSTLSASDSTSNGNNGTISGVSAAAGQIDGGASFGGSGYINVGAGSSLNITGHITIAAWVNTTSGGNNSNIFGAYQGGSPYTGYGFAIGASNGDGKVQYWSSAAGGWVESTGTVNNGNWHFIAVSFDGTYANFYIDGSASGSPAADAPESNAITRTIGAGAGGGFNNWYGTLDEIEVLNTSLSASWIATEYNNQNTPSSFLTIGTLAP